MVELMVAMAITSVITLLVLSLVGQSAASYAQTQRSVSNLSQARAFIQFFEHELSTRLPQTPWIHQAAGAAGGPGSSGKIAFIRAISQDEQSTRSPGDLGAGVYYVAFSSDRGGAVSPKLFRRMLDPVETQNLLQSPPAPAFPAIDPSSDEAMIYNVLHFEAVPQFADPASGGWVDWNANSPAPPSRLAMTIRFIDESSAQRFTREADWNRLATNPRDNERRLIRTFTRMIPIAK